MLFIYINSCTLLVYVTVAPCSQRMDPRANDLLQSSNDLLMLASALEANT